MLDSSAKSDLIFDRWITAQSLALSSIAQRISTALLEAPGRQRRPKVDQVERVSTIVHSLVGNLAVLHCGPRRYRALAVSMERQKITRYDRRGFRQVPSVIGAMANSGLLIVSPAFIKHRRTTIEATGWLLEELRNVDGDDGGAGEVSGRETILLFARTGRDGYGRRLPNVLIDYEDTAATNALRAEMEEVNAFLANQQIALWGKPQTKITLSRHFLMRDQMHPPYFNLHGRLYGAFWQNLPKGDRRGLTINGQPVVVLDFASMFPRLAYARVGSKPPAGDLYAIPGLLAHRAGTKAGFSALLSSPIEMKRLPSRVKAQLPQNWTAARFTRAVALTHPALACLFGRDVSLEFMYTESQILISVLKHLLDRGIPALPIHDGLMVGVQHAALAKQVMIAVPKSLALDLPVSVEAAY